MGENSKFCMVLWPQFPSVHGKSQAPRARMLIVQRLVARRDSGIIEKNFFGICLAVRVTAIKERTELFQSSSR